MIVPYLSFKVIAYLFKMIIIAKEKISTIDKFVIETNILSKCSICFDNKQDFCLNHCKDQFCKDCFNKYIFL